LMLAGVYTILPLQSPLDILSTTLYPSSHPIPVFGPSSHPTPVITPSSCKRQTRPSEYLSRLPLRPSFQQGDNRTIFLIREYDCGFLGLRNGVVPGFSNIWGEERGLWGLRSVHPVSSLSFLKAYSDCSRY
jgi:polynucleotide 5'-hydroxyl-kinase GRC3/NOL9